MTGNWSIADLASRWRSCFSRSKELSKRPSGSDHLQLGARGEKLASDFLRREGYKAHRLADGVSEWGAAGLPIEHGVAR